MGDSDAQWCFRARAPDEGRIALGVENSAPDEVSELKQFPINLYHTAGSEEICSFCGVEDIDAGFEERHHS